MYDNEAINILMKNGYTQFDDSKIYAEIPHNTIRPEALGGDGVQIFSETAYCITGGAREFVSMANSRVYKGKYTNNYQEIDEATWALWVEELGVTEAFSHQDIQEMERIANMTFEERQAEVIADLKADKMNVAFELEVYSSAKGEEKKYTINLKVYSELQTQYASGGNVAFHDDSRTLHEVYTNEEALQLLTDIGLAVAERECTYDLWITRAHTVTTAEELEMVKNFPLTEEEQGYIAMIVGGLSAN